jgi:outer membrane protein OmpA-like peptidoglycan-associated protein
MTARAISIALYLFVAIGGIGSTTAAGTSATPLASAAIFDPATVRVSTKPLPAFPYLETPDRLKPMYRKTTELGFNQAYFIAGTTLHRVEGRLARQRFTLRNAGMSRLEVLRNYEQAIAALGGVRVDAVKPTDKAFIAANGGNRHDIVTRKIGRGETAYAYAAYLVRTAESTVWIALTVGSTYATVWILKEQPMEQSVAVTKAGEMKAALDKDGFIALYINFDTDQSALRNDGRPAVDEIAKLLKTNPGLKIAVEGHTDDTGDAGRNKVLSEQRAATIVAALKSAGVAPARLKSVGHGAGKPIADNRTEDGRARNRRVELVKL